MNGHTTVLPFRQLQKIDDPLTEIARESARRMLAEVLKAEADAFVAKFGDKRLPTGIGPLDVQRPKVRDRAATNTPDTNIRFTSNILPKWARRLVSLDALLPVLYLKGISTGDFQEALSATLERVALSLIHVFSQHPEVALCAAKRLRDRG